MTDNDTLRAEALRRYPVLTGTPNAANDALADQFAFGMNLPHALVENYFANGPRSQLAVHVAEDRLSKIRSIADRSKTAYDREFASPADCPQAHPSGYTREADWSTGSTPDTRVYAILARHPFERTPITSAIEFNAFAAHARREPTCELQMYGPGCDAFLSRFRGDAITAFLEIGEESAGLPIAILIPIVRGEVIVFVSICLDCRAAYYIKHGISSGEIVDPDDMID